VSTFENNSYQWRETYFVLFQSKNCPKEELVRERIRSIGPHIEMNNVRTDEDGRLLSCTVTSPDDFAALDICYLAGEEVEEQITTLVEQFSHQAGEQENAQNLSKLVEADARFDILHFEQVAAMADEEEDDLLDPGGLLLVMELLIELCQGVGIDPQTESFY